MGTRSRPQNPAPKRQLWLLLETDKQHPSGRVGLYRARIGTLAYQYRARATPTIEPPSRGWFPRSPFLSPAPYLQPGQQFVCWLTPESGRQKARLFLLLAAFFDPQTQLQHPIPTASAHTYRAFSPLSPPVPSFSLLAAPPRSLPLTRTRQTAPDAQQPGQCPYVACCTLPCRPRPPAAPDTLRRPTDRLCISPLLFNYPGIGTLLLLGLGARLV